VSERKALGRGFSALLQPAKDIAPGEADLVKQLKIDQITLNPWQPRDHFDESRLAELAQSIRIKGVIQPVLVRKNPQGGYELIAGERRLRASKLAGFDEIPAVIKDILDQDILEIALIENLQRADLNPVEEAKAYKNLLEQHSYTQDKLAQRIGKNRSTIANLLRLLALPAEILNDLTEGRISQGHGRALLSVEDPKRRLELRDKTLAEDLSVRQLEQLAAQKPTPKDPVAPVKISPEFELLRQKLEGRLSTHVKIKPKGKGGKIELNFSDLNDFNRILGLLNQK